MKTASKSQLLHRLSDGLSHQEVALCAFLGVESAILRTWIDDLAQFGVPVRHHESAPGRLSYCLASPIELLHAESIIDGMSPLARHCFGRPLVLLSTSSTNQVLMDEVMRNGHRACLAEHQNAGRGRRGHHWLSPFGSNLYMSVAFELQVGPQALAGLSLAMGVCLAQVIRKLGVTGIGLKWPNDLVTEHGKLGGILIELDGSMTQSWSVVVGVGINLAFPQGMHEQVDQSITDLRHELGHNPGRNACAGLFLSALAEGLVEYRRHGFLPFRHRWSALDVLLGKPVTVAGPQGDIDGWAGGIDARGALIVRTATDIVTLDAGDVSVRPRRR